MKPFKFFFRFSAFTQSPADEAKDTIPGAILCEEGEAQGHGYLLTKKFLEQVLACIGGKALKVRVNHPEEGKASDLFTLVGKALNCRLDSVERDGKQVACIRGDIHLFDDKVGLKDRILDLAKQAQEFFGMSLDFAGKAGKKLSNGLREIACEGVTAVDFVGEPAAAGSLLNIPTVDSTQKVTTLPDMKLSIDFLKRIGLDETATEEQINAKLAAIKLADEAPPKEETKEEKMAAMRAKFRATLEAVEDEDKRKEQLAAFDALFADEAPAIEEEKHDEPDGDEEVSPALARKVERLAMRFVTKNLAAIGRTTARLSVPVNASGEHEKPTMIDTPVLTDEGKAQAAKLKVKEEDYLKGQLDAQIEPGTTFRFEKKAKA